MRRYCERLTSGSAHKTATYRRRRSHKWQHQRHHAIGRDKEIRSDAVAAAAVVYEHGVSYVKHICTLGRRYDGRYGSRAVSRISKFDCQSPNTHSIVFCDDHESVFALVRHGMGFEISLCGPAVNES